RCSSRAPRMPAKAGRPPACASLRASREATLHVRAGHQPHERDRERPVAHAEPRDRRTGTNPAEAPAHAEQCRAADRALRHLGRMHAESVTQERLLHHARREVVGDERDHDRAAEHQQQAHVVPEEEREHHLGLHHGRKREAEAEERPGSEHERERARPHAKARTRRAVIIAVARNVTTERIDGGWSEAIPQMPCRAGQPLESRGPNPATKRPGPSCHAGTWVTNGSPIMTSHANAPAMRPAAYTRRQCRLERKRSSWK